MKKPNPLVPQFVTMFFTLVPVPKEMGDGYIPIPTCCEDHILTGHKGIRLKFFAFMGFQLFKKVAYYAPVKVETENHGA